MFGKARYLLQGSGRSHFATRYPNKRATDHLGRRMRTRKYQIVVDDAIVVPPPLRAMIGIDHFGSLQFRQRSLVDALRHAGREAGLPEPLHLRNAAEVEGFIETLGEGLGEADDQDQLYLFCPANVVAACDDIEFVTFLRQIEFAQSNVFVPETTGRALSGWVLAPGRLLHRLLRLRREGGAQAFFEEIRDSFIEVRDRLNLIDVSDERTLLNFLSGQFDARHFNALERAEYTVTKRSRDIGKMRREFAFYGHTPPEMQMFLVQPFDFKVEGETASYRMERLFIPDMAQQMVHGALQPHEFDRFLEHIFHVFSIRPEKRASATEEDAAIQALYVDKVIDRIAALKLLPDYRALAPSIERACGGVDALVARYLAQFEKARRRLRQHRLVLGHGDPCFSNILYSKTNQFLKLIDARGADNAEGLYTHAYYDVAKLSHSVLGGYDFINQGLYAVTLDPDLRPRLRLESRLERRAQDLFVARLAQAGFDYHLTRLCEASLFISMTPMHIDRPLKVLAFLINAAEILDGLESRKPVGSAR
jgi:hypothetical protein